MKANLLRVVKSALAHTRPTSDHPDANVLGAFAENTLLARERAAVAGHLADCADCRDLLALAFGTMEPAPAAVAERRPARPWSAVWNWAASVAVVCIVVSAVWEFRAQRTVPVEAPPGPPAIHAPASASVPARRFTPPPSKALRVAAAKELETPVLPPPPPVPSAPPQADALAKVQQEIPPPQYRMEAALAQANLSAEHRMKTARSVSPMQQPAFAGSMASRVMVSPASPVRWTIVGQDHGIVQRSEDGGATWTTVPIGDQVSFRAVASAGSDVWAGGSAGALFHSADSGAHWKRVETGVTDTIVGIRPSGAGAAVVTTDAGHTWRLTDTPR